MATATLTPEDTSGFNATKLVRRLSNAAKRTMGKEAISSGLPLVDHPTIPRFMLEGVAMLKVSSKKRSQRLVRLLPEQGQIAWQSNSLKSVLFSDGGWTYLNLEAIIELRFGSDATPYRIETNLGEEVEPRWMTIIYMARDGNDRRVKMLHLVAMRQEVANAWRDTLQEMIKERKVVMAGDLREGSERWKTWVRRCWKLTDENQDERASFADVARICRSLGILLDNERLKADFDAVDTQKKGYLTMEDFHVFVRRIRYREEVANLVQELEPGQGSLPLASFVAFLQKNQQATITDKDAASIFHKYSVNGPLDRLSVEEFSNFLGSADNSPFSYNRTQITQDMTRPLCEYYISSSHNTYLIGNQLSSDSSVEGYIRALQQGCRCVELDVWNGPDGQPAVFHGRTLTSKVSLKDVLQAIAKYAFVSSCYPVILSLEVHCDTAQQDVMANLFKEHLGSALVDKPATDGPADLLPSPEDLKGRFLIKAKNLFELTQAQDKKVQPREVKVDAESDTTTTTTESSEGDLKRIIARIKSSSSSNSGGAVSAPPVKAPMSAALAALIVYTIGVKYRGFNKKEVYHPFHILSLGERRLSKTLKEAKSDLLAHNRSHLVRSYPAAFRFNSTNCLPQTAWAAGVQLVAINWQTYDLGSEINHAFFRRNGGCGYVLKPEFLRMKDPAAKDKEVLAAPVKMNLHISVLSAQQLIKTVRKRDSVADPMPISPYVEVAVFAPGVEASKAPRRTTSVVKGNGFNPVFPEAAFDLPFEVVGRMVDLVFLQLQVFDDNGDSSTPIARCVVSLGELQPGYRHLPLCDTLGQEFLFSSLFVSSCIWDLP